MSPLNPITSSLMGAMTVTALDSVTVRIESERLTHMMDAVLAEWVFVVYSNNSDGTFVFTGPFAIAVFEARQMQLVPNE